MNRDLSFIKFYTDFAEAKQGENPPISKLNYKGFIQQRTDETFLQITNSNTPIVFVGGYLAELVDNCGNIKRDITGQFYFDGFIDSNGINQIEFEFGMIGKDFYTLPLHIKLTDLVNGNIWYSNSFCVTNYNSEISSRADYWNEIDIRKRSVRIANCYEHSPQNELSSKQYTASTGNRVNYKNITTYLRKYLIDTLDFFTNDRLPEFLNYNNLFINGQRMIMSDLKNDERIQDTNFLTAEFVVNPQNDYQDWVFQIYEELAVIERVPIHLDILSSTDGLFSLTFNKNISILGDVSVVVYKDGVSFNEGVVSALANVLSIDCSSATFTLGNYSIFVEANKIYNNTEFFGGYELGEWNFTIAEGEYEGTEYSNEFLTD